MGKIQRITGLQYKFSLFNLSEDFDTYYNRFLESDLGKIYLGIPWNDLVESFELEEKQMDIVIEEVISSVAKWNQIAKEIGISRSEIEIMEPAFAVY